MRPANRTRPSSDITRARVIQSLSPLASLPVPGCVPCNDGWPSSASTGPSQCSRTGPTWPGACWRVHSCVCGSGYRDPSYLRAPSGESRVSGLAKIAGSWAPPTERMISPAAVQCSLTLTLFRRFPVLSLRSAQYLGQEQDCLQFSQLIV